MAVGPDGGLNALKHVIFCHSVMEQHLTPYTYTAIARDPIRESTPNFAIRFIVEQILRICCYLKFDWSDRSIIARKVFECSPAVVKNFARDY